MDPSQLGPLGLIVLMTLVGMELSADDFRRVASTPRAVIGGTLGQLLLLPLMTWGVMVLLSLPPIFGAGAVLVAVSPGAGISNILSALARANIALSVTLTAFASVLATVTLPALSALFVGMALEDRVDVEVPVGALVGQLTVSLLIPIAVGMWIRQRWPEFVIRNARRMQRIAIGAIVLVVVLAVALGEEQELSFADVEAGLLGALAWTLCAMGIGYGVGSLLRLSADDRATLTIEFAARNIAVATIVALSGLGRLDLTLFSAAYIAVGYPICGIYAVWRGRRRAGA